MTDEKIAYAQAHGHYGEQSWPAQRQAAKQAEAAAQRRISPGRAADELEPVARRTAAWLAEMRSDSLLMMTHRRGGGVPGRGRSRGTARQA